MMRAVGHVSAPSVEHTSAGARLNAPALSFWIHLDAAVGVTQCLTSDGRTSELIEGLAPDRGAVWTRETLSVFAIDS